MFNSIFSAFGYTLLLYQECCQVGYMVILLFCILRIPQRTPKLRNLIMTNKLRDTYRIDEWFYML